MFGVGNGLRQTLVVYGQIPPKQNVIIGSYRDIVNVNIIFWLLSVNQTTAYQLNRISNE